MTATATVAPTPPGLARRIAYEGFLTFVLLFGAVTVTRWVVGPSAISRDIPDIRVKLVVIGAVVAVLLTTLILSPMGRQSGGHMNPAITVSMWRYRVFPRREMPYYIAAQLAGSAAGVIAGRIVWGSLVARAPVSYAVLQPAHGWSFGGVFAVESLNMLAIVLIVGVLLAIPRANTIVPYVVGLLVGATIALLGPLSGGSANPARQFGPAVIAGQTHVLIAYLLAPIVGAIIAPAIRDLLQREQVRTHALCGLTRAVQSAPAKPAGNDSTN